MALATAQEPVRGLVRASFPATEDDVRRQLDRLLRLLEDRGLSAAFRADVAIVLGEVLNNIVEHALAGRSDGCIGLVITRGGGRVQIETTDCGRPLPPQLLTSADLPDLSGDIPELPEGGFGWFIIHSLAQDMVYERAAGVNRLSFCFAEG